MDEAEMESVVVYRGMDTVVLDLVEDALRVRGLSPRRLGRANPALLGLGVASVEQLIAVPHACVQEASRVVQQWVSGSSSPDDEAALIAEALGAAPLEPPLSAGSEVMFNRVKYALIAGLMLLLLIGLLR